MVDILKRVEELSDLFDNKGSERLEFNSGGGLLEEYYGKSKLAYQAAVDDGFQGTYEEYLRLMSPSKSFADGGRIGFNTAGLAQANLNKQKTAAEKYGMSLKKYQGLSETEKQTLKSKASRELKRKQGIQTDGITVSQNIKKMPSGKFKFETQAGGKFSKTFSLGTKLEEVEKFRDETLLKRKTRVRNPDRGEYKSVKGQKHIKFNGVTYQVNIQRGNQGSFYTSDLDKAIKKRDELVKKFPPKTMTDYNIKERPKKVNAEILKLSKNTAIKNIFNTGVLTNEAIKEAAKILNVDRATAIDRLENLASAFAGDRKNVPGIKPSNIDNARKIAALLPGAKTKAAELATGVPFTGESIKVPKDQIIKAAKYPTSLFDIDEARATATGLKRSTSPYSIFGQVIDQNVNRIAKGGFAGAGWDSKAGTLEKNLDEAIQKFGPNSRQAKAAMFEYNREAAKFESKINKGKLRGTKPIRIPRISLDAPSKTIARYNSFNKKYQNIFDNNFKTKKYSFVIPKDLRTIPELRDDILNPKSTTYKNMINTLKKGFNEFDEQKLFEKIKSRTPQQLQKVLKKIGRIASVDDFTGPGGFPLTAGLDSNIGIKPVDEKNFFQRNPVTTGTGLAVASSAIPSVRRAAKAVAPKLLGPAGLALEGYFMKQAYDEGRTIPEVLAKPFMLEGAVADAQERLRMTKPERQAVNRAQIADDFSDLDTDFLTPIIPGSFNVDVDAVRQRVGAEEEAARKLRALQRAAKAGGGIAGLSGGIDMGPQRRSMNPDSQGLQGLMKRGIKT
jgi:hypothetical protein